MGASLILMAVPPAPLTAHTPLVCDRVHRGTPPYGPLLAARARHPRLLATVEPSPALERSDACLWRPWLLCEAGQVKRGEGAQAYERGGGRCYRAGRADGAWDAQDSPQSAMVLAVALRTLARVNDMQRSARKKYAVRVPVLGAPICGASVKSRTVSQTPRHRSQQPPSKGREPLQRRPCRFFP